MAAAGGLQARSIEALSPKYRPIDHRVALELFVHRLVVLPMPMSMLGGWMLREQQAGRA
jgi:hypothetical protein